MNNFFVKPALSSFARRRLLLVGLCISGLASAVPAHADITSGIWQREDGNARVRVAPCGGALCAINVWIRNPGDEKVGDRLVLNVKPAGPGVYEGTAFDPQRNLSFTSRITYSADRMTTSGCVLMILCKSVAWTRAP
jgi:uncharacterized protein (DUF2147 family)